MELSKAQQRIAQKNREYWSKREEEQLKHYIKNETEYSRQINRIYSDMLDNCQKEIDSFYGKYASKEGITIAEAKKRVAKLDIEAYERKAARYVKDRDFSEKANEEMRLYNLTMKVNRLEMLKANIGLELISGHDELDKFMADILQGRSVEELERQAGILGKTIQNNAETAHSIVNASFHNATFSERIWTNFAVLRAEIGKNLQTGMIAGKNPRVLARDIQKTFGTSEYNAERLMRTELARVQVDSQFKSITKNGFTQYQFIVNSGCCDICQAVAKKNDGIYNIADATPGDNAPPIHPNCRCSVASYEDDEEYEAWLDYLANGGTTEQWNAIPDAEKAAIISKTELKNSPESGKIQSDYGFKFITGEHSREFDLAATNPNYGTKKREWTTNCQRCVSAYEARRRGYDVQAKPRILDGSDRMPFMFDKTEGWTSVYKDIKPISCTSNRTAGVKTKVEKEMAGFGDGARAIIRVQWQKRYGGGGHVFIAEQVDGKTLFIDPQNNKTDVSGYFSLAKTKETYVMRIDNLEFTDNITKCCQNAD